jgi:soluble lytic murein transglycosylase-like protein
MLQMLRILSLVAVLSIAVTLLPAPLSSLVPPRDILLDTIKAHAGNHGLDWRLVVAVILVESEGKHTAVSKMGARGLMQVMPMHARLNGLPVTVLFDPYVNIWLGCAYLGQMVKQFGLKGGVQAYNLGATNYVQGQRNRTYLRKVFHQWHGIMVEAPVEAPIRW